MARFRFKQTTITDVMNSTDVVLLYADNTLLCIPMKEIVLDARGLYARPSRKELSELEKTGSPWLDWGGGAYNDTRDFDAVWYVCTQTPGWRELSERYAQPLGESNLERNLITHMHSMVDAHTDDVDTLRYEDVLAQIT